MKYCFSVTVSATCLMLLLAYGFGVDSFAQTGRTAVDEIAGIRKLRDVVIYSDIRFHAAFPSIVKRRGGELIVAFRRAPNRKIFGEKGTNHVDPNSYLMKVTSRDGVSWKEPELVYAHPFGGSQDPCMLQLRDGTLLCTSYGWAFVRPDGIPNLRTPNAKAKEGVVFLGGYVLRSQDGGETWQGPSYPPHVDSEINYNALGEPLPAYNRGALYEGKDGRIFWVVAVSDSSASKRKSSTHLLISEDKGVSWKYSCRVAADDSASFNETSVYETLKGNLVAFMRTGGLDDQACIARSTDGGKSFEPWQTMGFQGHPLHALRLRDDRVLVTYGYRHKPYGIRARILNEECTDFATAPEIILRSDGGTTDIGYPWAVQLDKKRVLVVYYFSVDGGPQHIAGTILTVGGN